MRIIWFTPGFAAHEKDTDAVPYLQQLALELRQYADLRIVAVEYPFTNKPYFWNDIPVYPCNGQNRRWFKWLSALHAWKYSRMLSKEHTNIVFQSFWLGWAAVLAENIHTLLKLRFFAALRPPASIYIHFCTLMGQDVLPANLRRLQLLGHNMQKRLIVLSDFQNDKLAQTIGFKAPFIIPFGIRSAEMMETFHEERSIDILGVGSLNVIKNWGKWLEIVASVANKTPAIRAMIIGKGLQKNHLTALAQQLGIANRITIRSDLNRPAVLACMRRSKVMLHTSDFEGQGYVFNEAAAQGCYVVSTPVGVAPEIADCGGNMQELILKVHRALRLPAPEYPFVSAKMEDTVHKYLHLYQQSIYL